MTAKVIKSIIRSLYQLTPGAFLFPFILCFYTEYCLSQEVVYYHRGDVRPDMSEPYHSELLHAIMSVTEHKYGKVILEPSSVSTSQDDLPRMRRLHFLTQADNLDVIARSAQDRWLEKVTPVAIPTQKGVLGYRIFLIHSDNAQMGVSTKTVNDLKKFTVGGGVDWSSTRSFKALGLDVYEQNSYTPLIKALAAKRFDLLDRGAIEVSYEVGDVQKSIPEIQIEPHIIVQLQMPVFYFVTPKKPELKKRIEEGLELVVANGTLDKLFDKHYGHLLTALQVGHRTLIKMPSAFDDQFSQINDLKYQLDLSKY